MRRPSKVSHALLVLVLGIMNHRATGETVASPDSPVSRIQEEILAVDDMMEGARPQVIEERLHGLLEQAERGSNDERAVLLALTAHYKERNRLVNAIATLEEAADRFKDDPDRPEWFFELGLLHRELGAIETAVARFYQVLNPATIRGAHKEAYKDLSQRAQFEIARTYFQQGRYSLARELFERMRRLDLNEADDETVLYYLTRCEFSEHMLDAVARHAALFTKSYPESARKPEVLFMRAQAMERTGRSEEALEIVMDLLREEHPTNAGDPERWKQWQRKAGNFFANHYYAIGDASTALSIYQALAKLGDEPAWLWPVVYQIGICAERLGAGDRARDAYEWLRSEAGETNAAGESLSLSLQLVLEGAAWRQELLERSLKIETKARTLNEGTQKPL